MSTLKQKEKIEQNNYEKNKQILEAQVEKELTHLVVDYRNEVVSDNDNSIPKFTTKENIVNWNDIKAWINSEGSQNIKTLSKGQQKIIELLAQK